MKFIDEAYIIIQAGKGGHGCLSFRREKFVPLGGPNGGDGGDGGNVYLRATTDLNTLVEFRFNRLFKAKNGQPGMGANRTGKSGEDLFIPVPVGTIVHNKETSELIADLNRDQQECLVAKGGYHGLGNARFKSSVNRAPRKTTVGTPGEKREVQLELKLLADVGLLGLPNAGKSTLVRSVSAAKPRVADYPFTTLNPSLGVVRISSDQSFVIADIPGLISGAAEGAGLGIQFLKHLSRTGILLHIVDIAPLDGSDPVENIHVINQELVKYSDALSEKEQWLVINKMDLRPPEEADAEVKRIVSAIKWPGPVYAISAMNQQGTDKLVYDLMNGLRQTA